jgi:hypothetical protein
VDLWENFKVIERRVRGLGMGGRVFWRRCIEFGFKLRFNVWLKSPKKNNLNLNPPNLCSKKFNQGTKKKMFRIDIA